jgi:hypothetical protein
MFITIEIGEQDTRFADRRSARERQASRELHDWPANPPIWSDKKDERDPAV